MPSIGRRIVVSVERSGKSEAFIRRKRSGRHAGNSCRCKTANDHMKVAEPRPDTQGRDPQTQLGDGAGIREEYGAERRGAE